MLPTQGQHSLSSYTSTFSQKRARDSVIGGGNSLIVIFLLLLVVFINIGNFINQPGISKHQPHDSHYQRHRKIEYKPAEAEHNAALSDDFKSPRHSQVSANDH